MPSRWPVFSPLAGVAVLVALGGGDSGPIGVQAAHALLSRERLAKSDASVATRKASFAPTSHSHKTKVEARNRWANLNGRWQPLRFFADAAVSCKGQVFVQTKDDWAAAFVIEDTCGFERGSCKQLKYSKGPQLEGPEHCTNQDAPHGNPPERSPEVMKKGCHAPEVAKIVVITQPQWGAYYHFLVDSLPRIVWVREQRPDLLQDSTTFFHVGSTTENAQSWARMVGITTELEPDSKMGTLGGKNRLLEGWWTAKTVVWPPTNGCVNKAVHEKPHAVSEMRSLVVHSMQQLMGPSAPSLAQSTAPMMLLIRRDPHMGRARVILNHDELLEGLSAFSKSKGWTVEVYSDYPSVGSAETCEMFHRADLVVGPHGAGFSNLMCSRAGVPIVELQQKKHARDFELLSGTLDMPYFFLRTEMDHGGGLTVAVPEVIAVVKDAVAASPRSKKA